MADIDEEAFMSSLGDEGSRSRGRRSCWGKTIIAAHVVLAMCTMPSILGFTVFCSHAFLASREAPEFSMHLAGYAGLVPPENNANNATAMAVVSPVFSLKVDVGNPRHVHVLQPWCYTGGEVVVSYSGVALAWARVPLVCIHRRMKALPTTTTELFRVSPMGRGVGLSEDLGRRLASELRQGSAQVTASMKLFYQDNKKCVPSRKYNGPLLHSFQLMLNGQRWRTEPIIR